MTLSVDATKLYNSTFTSILDELAPLKTKTVRDDSESHKLKWVDEHLRKERALYRRKEETADGRELRGLY